MTNIATNTPYLRLDLKTSRIESNQTRKTQKHTIWECTTEIKNKAKTKTNKKTKRKNNNNNNNKKNRQI